MKLREQLDQMTNLYEKSGRDVAEFIAGGTSFLGVALLNLFWSVLAAVILGSIFGGIAYAVGFLGVWLAVIAPNLGRLLGVLVLSTIPGALIGGTCCLLLGASFYAWWFVGTVAFIVWKWASTVTTPVAPPVEQPCPFGASRPARPDELQARGFLR